MTSNLRLAIVMAASAAAVLFLSPNEALAFQAPGAGSFAYDLYDITVNKILKGPIGFVGGVGAVAAGAVAVIRQMLAPGLLALLGGAAMLKADTIVESLGMMI